jgi:hypothetical protein
LALLAQDQLQLQFAAAAIAMNVWRLDLRHDEYLELFAKQLDGSEVGLPEDAIEFGPFDDEESDEGEANLEFEMHDRPCPHCAGQLIPHRQITKPSRGRLMDSSRRPSWCRSY